MEFKKWGFVIGLVIIIIIAVIFIKIYFLDNSKDNLRKDSFNVNAIFLKSSIADSESSENNIKIINTDSKTRSFSLKIKGLNNFIKIDENETEFSLKPNEEKDIKFTFIPEKGNYKVYLGELDINSEKEIKNIPIIIEVHSKEIFFYGTLDIYPPQDTFILDSIFNSDIKIYDVSNLGKNSVEVSYFITDLEGNDVFSESENLIVYNKIEFFKNFDLKGIKEGKYILGIKVRYRDSVGITSIFFNITNNETELNISRLKDQRIIFYFIILMLLVIILFIIKLGLCIFNKKIKPLKNLDKNIAKQKSCLYKNIEKKDKLQRKLETLKKAYSSGYISKDSYLKGVRRVKRLLNK